MDQTGDLNILFADDGVTAVIKRAGWDDLEVEVLFDDSYLSSLGAGTTDPQITARAADFAEVAKSGTVVSVRNTEYRIKALQPDGAGLITVTLTQDAGAWR